MLKKLFYFLLVSCFINPLFAQLNDEKTYFFKDKNDKEGQIVYSKARTDGLNWISYRFDSDTRPNKQKVAQIVAKKDKFKIRIAGIGTNFIAEYQNDYAFTAYSKYSNGSIYEKGRMLKRKTNLSRCSDARSVLEDQMGNDCDTDRMFKKIKLKPKHSKKMPVYNDIIVKYGEWKGYHSNGKLSYKVQYRNGFPQSGYTFFSSGYVESFLSGPETITYKESDKKSVVTGKNYERALKFVKKEHVKKFEDNAKEVRLDLKKEFDSIDNKSIEPHQASSASMNDEGFYEHTYFQFIGDYDRIEIAKKTKPNWSYIEYEAHKIYMAFGYSPTPAWYDDMRRQYRVSYTDTTKVDSKWKYKVKCSSGKCEIIK